MKVFITGASSGIGEAVARLFASRHAQLILCGRDQGRLERVARETCARRVVSADLSQEAGQEEVLKVLREELPELIINNAGFGFYGETLHVSWEEQKRLIEVNMLAPLRIASEGARLLIESKRRGTIVNISSLAGEYPTPGMSLYGASKAFLTHLSEALDTEWAPQGVRVLVSCPGMVRTSFATRAAGQEVELGGVVYDVCGQGCAADLETDQTGEE